MRLLEQMKREYDELGVAIRVLERMTQNGREETALRKVHAAYTRLRRERGAEAKTPRKARRAVAPGTLAWVKANKVVNGKPPEVEVPKGLSVKGKSPQEAIVQTLTTLGRPAFTPEIVAVMQGAGFKSPSPKYPTTRLIGIHLANLGKKGLLRRTPQGWATA